ncbi:unnamed protein product [Orchesella dallaii]|uniref:Protein lifeguard 1 n=1 Tax=Orchesella dallaii TaxID=48710 RepID=A0ABP1RT02_9HEXA
MATPFPPYPHPPPPAFQHPQQPFPPFPQGQPMMMGMPPAGMYGGGGFPSGQPIPMGGPMPMGPGGGPPPQAFYAQQLPPTAFPMGMGGFHNVNMGDDYEEGNKAAPGEQFSDTFSDKTIRRAFIRKVYSILSVQLLVTAAFIALFLFHDGLRAYSRRNRGLFYAAMALTLVTMLAMACCESVRRKAPQNFICLAVFTLAEGFVLGTAASTYSQSTVLLAVGITAVITLSLTLFSFQTKWDFTAHGGILFVAGIVLFIFGILMIFLRNTFPILHLVYACVGALVFCAYLVYDTQLMMGGNHKVRLINCSTI